MLRVRGGRARSFAVLALACAALIAWTGTATAAPIGMAAPAAAPESAAATVLARVKVLELTAREAPNASAAILQAFTEGTNLAVSLEESNGFRSVRLLDGRTAYVAAAGLSFDDRGPGAAAGAPVAVAPVSPLTPATAPPQATIFVKDLSHLRDLVKEDPAVLPLADGLVTRSRVSWGLVIAGGAIGLALVTLSFVFPQKDLCDTAIGCQENPNPGLLLGGLGAMVVLPTVGWAIYPSRGSVLDVMNAWNTRHPDSQFTVSNR